jgi:ORF6N domain
MARAIKSITALEEKVINKIYLIRDKKVMLDFDLAEMYAVETRQLKRQVKRNAERFPGDFMFELTKKEFENLRRQFGTSSWGGTRYMPMAFTEQGVAMLSSVLNSPTAIEVNIQIIRVFSKMRELLLTNKDILLKLEQVEKKMIQQDGKMNQYDTNIQLIFEALKKLLNPPQEPRLRIGFKP